MKGLPKFMSDFCIGLVKKTIEEREEHNIVRKDLIQFLIQLRNSENNKSGKLKINSFITFFKINF